MVGELFVLAEKSQKDSKKPSGQGRFLQWYFFLVAAFWMYFRFHPQKLLTHILHGGLHPAMPAGSPL